MFGPLLLTRRMDHPLGTTALIEEYPSYPFLCFLQIGERLSTGKKPWAHSHRRTLFSHHEQVTLTEVDLIRLHNVCVKAEGAEGTVSSSS